MEGRKEGRGRRRRGWREDVVEFAKRKRGRLQMNGCGNET